MGFTIERGTNVSHWLSQSRARGEERRNYFTRKDADLLAGLGLDHLRLPVDEEQLWNEAGDREPEAWALLESCLDWCDELGLRVIVDLHILRCHYFNAGPEGKTLFSDPTRPPHFARLWEELSTVLAGRDVDKVAYELMNEPVADDPADWNRAYRFPYEAIRRREPDRVIFLASNEWNQCQTFPDLEIPANDPNIVLTFHYYNPMFVTHYCASWVEETKAYDGPIQYPGRSIPEHVFNELPTDLQKLTGKWNEPFDRAVMAEQIGVALDVAKRAGLPLHCGEFGVVRNTPEPIRRAWYADFRSVAEEYGIAWSNWDYKGGFGLFDKDGNRTAAADELL